MSQQCLTYYMLIQGLGSVQRLSTHQALRPAVADILHAHTGTWQCAGPVHPPGSETSSA